MADSPEEGERKLGGDYSVAMLYAPFQNFVAVGHGQAPAGLHQ